MNQTMNRNEHLNRLRAGEIFDVLVIGGGATGLGAAVDAAARGHRVALVEQDDFAKGTSSRSTKLVHGGVRYLKQGNVKLVREALHERGRLAKNAPHLVHNMEFVIPNYTRFEQAFYGIGMKVYDRLAGRLGLGRSLVLGRDETVRRLPTVETRGLKGGVLYHDGQFDDSRLAINLAQTAAGLGAVVVNYCKCTGFVKGGDGQIKGVRVHDEEAGAGGGDGAEFEVHAKAVINATGVFVDELRKQAEPAATDLVTVSQGIHLVLPKKFLPGNAALMVPKTADGRVLFAVPWHDCVVVGTTDTPRPAASLEPRALDEEYEFVMTHAQKYLALDPTDSDVLSVFAGLRPLVKSGHGGSTAALSRDHTIVVGKTGLITITGGKWTTYRRMAEDVINHVEKLAGLARRPCRTADMPVRGATGVGDECEAAAGSLAVYGADATGVRALANSRPEWAERIHPALPYLRAEVIWHARQEMARTVEDVLARRTRALLIDARASIEAAGCVAGLLAGEQGRDGAWQRNQCDAYARLATGYVRVRLAA
ncbi:MAG: glycerol-3-phosphate dehydrogenase/oxidase [Opitutaceae bacterium]|jgi:glycerol-3-phosphate dehydrogenase|nr:glycerol-3-phosphate dehydrogenase/oxidase [Opitutaceae bacterium]